MKKLLTMSLLILSTLIAVGQQKFLTTDSDTSFWYRYYKPISVEIGLEPTETIQSEFYFRFWDGDKVIELRQVNNKLIGTSIFLIRQYIKNSKREEGRLYFRKYDLTEQTTQVIFELATIHKIIELPTDKLIHGWEGGLDGVTYITEHSDKDRYSFKNYWTPTLYQDKLKEAGQLVDFLVKLNGIGELKMLDRKFMDRQPFSSWYGSIGGSTVFSKTRK
jgi:hypothetical protein